MSTVQKLLETLSKATGKRQPSLSPEKQIPMQEFRQKVVRQYRQPWKFNDVRERKQAFPRLKNRQLDNWQIYRIPLSPRSFAKNQRSVKIPSVGKEFSKYTAHDGEGHLPYLYEGDLPKINRIKSLIYQTSINPVNTAKRVYFGLGKIRSNSFAGSNQRSQVSSFN